MTMSRQEARRLYNETLENMVVTIYLEYVRGNADHYLEEYCGCQISIWFQGRNFKHLFGEDSYYHEEKAFAFHRLCDVGTWHMAGIYNDHMKGDNTKCDYVIGDEYAVFGIRDPNEEEQTDVPDGLYVPVTCQEESAKQLCTHSMYRIADVEVMSIQDWLRG